jgi:hypothetical protein
MQIPFSHFKSTEINTLNGNQWSRSDWFFGNSHTQLFSVRKRAFEERVNTAIVAFHSFGFMQADYRQVAMKH